MAKKEEEEEEEEKEERLQLRSSVDRRWIQCSARVTKIFFFLVVANFLSFSHKFVLQFFHKVTAGKQRTTSHPPVTSSLTRKVSAGSIASLGGKKSF